MCILFIAYRVVPGTPLLVAANRDEFYHRPTRALQPWPEDGQLIAGKDLQAGGTWLGLHRQGRFAAITNVREPGVAPGSLSRGQIVLDALIANSPSDYLENVLAPKRNEYAGFNLISFDGKELWYCSNRHSEAFPVRLQPGVFGLSNAALDTPWPKLTQGKSHIQQLLCQPRATYEAGLWAILQHATPPQDSELPDTGVGKSLEKLLSTTFIQSETYGTRSSTLLFWHDNDNVEVKERRFGAEGYLGDSSYSVQLVN